MMPGRTLPLLLLCALAGPLCSVTHASTIVVPTNESTTSPEVTSMTAVTEEPTDRSMIFSPNATEPFVTSNLTEAPEITSTVVEDATEENTSVGYTTVTATDTTFTDSSTVVSTAMVDDGYATEMPHLNSSLIIEDDEGGLSTGQVVGIVIGSLVAVVVIIVVAVTGMRRMGQYSP
ncbi:podoplanin [Paramormyrops kingsleyae]|uniref:podoplanin n=1 Tax=Paramormyrops kingsleyae TaxID=1676925 RepID=UPI003B979A76